jgi:hypothetical protein
MITQATRLQDAQDLTLTRPGNPHRFPRSWSGVLLPIRAVDHRG